MCARVRGRVRLPDERAEMTELILAGSAVILALLLAARGAWKGDLVVALVLCCVGLGLAALLFAPGIRGRQAHRDLIIKATPTIDHGRDGYVGSAECMACHEGEHVAWHASFHRTMTSRADEAIVHGDFNNRKEHFHGRDYELTNEDGRYFVKMADPTFEWNNHGAVRDPSKDSTLKPPMVTKEIVMTTGSHHQQVYWVEGGKNPVTDEPLGQLDYMPLVWLIEDQRWVPFRDIFMWYPGRPEHLRLWNYTCIHCHSTHGVPAPERLESGAYSYDTRAAELGISCEGCHGPGADHIVRNKDPLYRWSDQEERDPTIVNPMDLDHRRASEVCGLCHSITHSRDQNRWYESGFRYRPGDSLEDTEKVLRLGEEASKAFLAERTRESPHFVENSWWPDGMVRVSGREFNGLVETPCYQYGELSCLSCHSVHHYQEADDQLIFGRNDNATCTQCHEDLRSEEAQEQHSHHKAGGSGNSCMDCHMPRTSYGLLKAIRSHEITSPSVESTVTTGRPNACNLCHLDKTLSWTQDALKNWYDTPEVELTDDQKTVSASVLDLLTGDAGNRALVSWHLGWKPAQEVSGTEWMAPYLALHLDDAYSPVRYFAKRSLKTLEAFGEAVKDFDYVGPVAQRQAVRAVVDSLWKGRASARLGGDEAVLLNSDGTLKLELFERLKSLMSKKKMDLGE